MSVSELSVQRINFDTDEDAIDNTGFIWNLNINSAYVKGAPIV